MLLQESNQKSEFTNMEQVLVDDLVSGVSDVKEVPVAVAVAVDAFDADYRMEEKQEEQERLPTDTVDAKEPAVTVAAPLPVPVETPQEEPQMTIPPTMQAEAHDVCPPP